jgi:hypothetical protein
VNGQERIGRRSPGNTGPFGTDLPDARILEAAADVGAIRRTRTARRTERAERRGGYRKGNNL